MKGGMKRQYPSFLVGTGETMCHIYHGNAPKRHRNDEMNNRTTDYFAANTGSGNRTDRKSGPAERNGYRKKNTDERRDRPTLSEQQRLEKQLLLEELSAYDQKGCSLFLNGKPASPARVSSACVREGSAYMRDFIPDEDERIREIHFIRLHP